MFAVFKEAKLLIRLRTGEQLGRHLSTSSKDYGRCISVSNNVFGSYCSRRHHRERRFFPNPLSGTNFQGGSELARSLQVNQMSSSAGSEDDNETSAVEIDGAEFEEFEIADGEAEDDLSHLRVKLYSLEENENIRDLLEELYDAGSIQQVLDLVEEHVRESSEIDLKIQAQALVTIWDIQKLMFKISPNFDPERDYLDKPSFIEKITQNSTFLEKIVKPVIDNCERLEDEPLVASLLCLKRFGYNVRSPQCEKFVDECLRRKDTLSLPSISRLCVSLRNESLYGNMIVAKFYPLLWNYLDTMKDDLEVRLLSISLRNTLRIISVQIIEKFRNRIDELKDDFSKWETVTLCKVLLLLMACRGFGEDSKHVFNLVGEALVDRVPTMPLMDLLSLQKFVELGFLEPYELVEALIQRMMRIVQQGVSSSIRPRLDLLASISPYLRSVDQRTQMTVMLMEYLENRKFEFASGVLLVMLRYTKCKDTKGSNTYWNKAANMVDKIGRAKVLDRKVLKLARDYVNFCFGMGFIYRCKDFEYSVKRYLRIVMDNYVVGGTPSLILPNDFARAFGFLIGVASFTDPMLNDVELLKLLDDFGPQFKPVDLSAISRGLDSLIMNLFFPKRPIAKYYQRIIEIASILEEQCSRLLLDPTQNLNFTDALTLHKVALVTRKVTGGDSPVLEMSMKKLLVCELEDARSVKDLAHALLIGASNYPNATQSMADYIWNNKAKQIAPDVVEKFVNHAYSVGWESDMANDVVEVCSTRLTETWDKLSFLPLLQSAIGLCYYRQLSPELVQNIFSVDFLDQMDNELKLTHNAYQYPLKLRQTMMELNRAVCIDMPNMNLPWFHGKFCEELLAMNPSQEYYLHDEVRSALSNIVGDEAAVQCNMCSPYYYPIDFLIEFDEKNRPIKKQRKKPTSFFQKFIQTQEYTDTVKRKVAVLLLPPTAFTKGVRTLKGYYKLRRRHLEMLGYDVVEIDPVHWNSMFMSENIMRQNFLETRLYANANFA